MPTAIGGGPIGMTGDTTADLQNLIDRLQRGDDSARGELLARAYQRLRRIASTLFHRDFPGLKDRHDLESVVDESWPRLMRALETARPPTVEDFLRLVAHKVRQVLLDMADRQRRRDAWVRDGLLNASERPVGVEPADDSLEPGRLALLTEFHRQVENLPADQRTVFDLHYYTDLPQAEVARVLGIHPRKVSYLWVAATEQLAEWLDGLDEFLV
jgi:RNA polymerase sigma factor (sigma-70 family)